MKSNAVKSNVINKEELLRIIAKSMGAKVVRWDSVDETVQRKISFAKIVDASTYITEKEMQSLELKSRVY